MWNEKLRWVNYMERGYPNYMLESIELVKQTREKRLKEIPPLMSLEEREQILRKYHPDYREDSKRAVKVGVNAGELMPNEVADLIESYPLIQPEQIDLSTIDYDADILIIGAGGAGLTSALWAVYSGVDVDRILIVTKLRLGDSNSKMSQGGIQAADCEDDSPSLHYLDVLGGGHFTNDPELVKWLVREAPMIIKWHEELGVMYDKDEEGCMVVAPGGGTCRKRMHSAKDYTGMEIVRVLMDEVRNLEIPVLEFKSAIELLMDDAGKVAGTVLWDMEKEDYSIARAKATLMATGGFGRLHVQGFETTNHYGATADGLVMANRVGARIIDMDSVQYHPTGSSYPEQIIGLLCTEKLRGRGAQPVNKYGEEFVYPLEPRDVEAAALIRECAGGNGLVTPTGMPGVWLDTPLIDILHGEGTIEKEFSAMFLKYKRFDIDMTQDPILVYPTLHFQNGGIVINEHARVVGVPGLFAAGETTGGVHGKNRLMGNSILDYCVYGRRMGIYSADYVQNANVGKLSLDHVTKYVNLLEDAGIPNRKAPILLPEYRGERTLSHTLDLL
jgi:succinate dehydrogenase/fumarate reductase flavoprotein subunit